MKYIIWVYFLFFGLTANAQQGDAILGEYWSPTKDGRIQVYKKGNNYVGKLVWVQKQRKDIYNPDSKLQSRELLGSEILWGFVYDANDKEWIDGKIYDPKTGKTYSCKMWLDGRNLKVRGYIGVSMLGRTELFVRYK